VNDQLKKGDNCLLGVNMPSYADTSRQVTSLSHYLIVTIILSRHIYICVMLLLAGRM
jgi:hypothetical protein